jgi:membrane protease YdiL (CAAX protease family)
MLTNRQLIVPYALPYFAYVGLASVPADMLGREANYGLRLLVVGALLLWARRWHCPLKGPRPVAGSVAWGVAAGIFGAALWVGLLAPFVSAEGAQEWTPLAFWLRFAAAGALVPVFEELAMRGFVFRLALQWNSERRKGSSAPLQDALDERSLNEVRPGEWSWPAVLVSTAVFAAGHGMAEWPAAAAYGLLMCGLWVWRGDLVSCIAAHAATNVALALFVLGTGNWQYW